MAAYNHGMENRNLALAISIVSTLAAGPLCDDLKSICKGRESVEIIIGGNMGNVLMSINPSTSDHDIYNHIANKFNVDPFTIYIFNKSSEKYPPVLDAETCVSLGDFEYIIKPPEITVTGIAGTTFTIPIDHHTRFEDVSLHIGEKLGKNHFAIKIIFRDLIQDENDKVGDFIHSLRDIVSNEERMQFAYIINQRLLELILKLDEFRQPLFNLINQVQGPLIGAFQFIITLDSTGKLKVKGSHSNYPIYHRYRSLKMKLFDKEMIVDETGKTSDPVYYINHKLQFHYRELGAYYSDPVKAERANADHKNIEIHKLVENIYSIVRRVLPQI